MKIGKEVKIAILAIVSLAILYLGFNFLKGIDFFDPTKEYYAVYERISGLTESNPVLLSGMNVGRVSKIEILQEQDNKVKVYFEVREDITLGENSKAVLYTDILGSQTIVLERNEVQAPLAEGSEVDGYIEPSLSTQIQEQSYPVLQTLDSVGKHLNSILENIDENEEMISGILKDVKKTTGAIAKISEKADEVQGALADLKKITGILTDEETGIEPLLTKANGVADSLNALEMGRVVKRIDSTLAGVNSVIASVKEGDGTINKLLTDDSLYNSLNKTLVDLDQLLIDVKERPKKYVHFSIFGRKDKE